MLKRLTLKNIEFEQRLFGRRVLTIVLLIILMVCFLIARLVHLQIFQRSFYTTLSEQNQFTLVPIEPARGLIYDRNGVLLAENTPTFSLELIPERINQMRQTIAELRKLIAITEEDIKNFQKQLKQHRRFEPVPLRFKLTEEEMANFAVNQYRFPGVLMTAHLTRYYPKKEEMTAILGYVSRINQQEAEQVDKANYSATNTIGKIGVEKYFENTLHGKVGYQQIETDASGRTVRVLKDISPVPGDNLYLTIDSRLQQVVQQLFEGHKGALVAIDPRNGDILAMVASPSFDGNLFVNGIDPVTYKSLQTAPHKPLYNRAVRGLYPPASTIKPYFALGALDAGVIDEHFHLYDPGYFQLGGRGHVYHDWIPHGHGDVDVMKAITVSCDTFFFTVGTRMGIDALARTMKKFGYGSLTGVEIGEELPGLVPTPEWKQRALAQKWFAGDTVSISIGQGYSLVTPLQLANAVAIIAGRGQHYRPHLLHHRQRADGKMLLYQPQALPNVIFDQNTWDLVLTGMEDVAMSPAGTAFHFFGDKLEYTVAGKTGTAQVVGHASGLNGEEHKNHSLFVGFAPVDNPRIAIGAIVENNTQSLAKKISRAAFDFYLLGKEPAKDEETEGADPTGSH